MLSLSYAGASYFAVAAASGTYWLTTGGALASATNLYSGAQSAVFATPLERATEAADVYALTLAADEFITVQVAPSYPNQARIELLDAAGTVLALGEWSYGETAWTISQFKATSAGTYYVRVKATVISDYQLTVTRQGGVEERDTSTFNALSFPLSQNVTGYLGNVSNDDDVYELAVNGGIPLTITPVRFAGYDGGASPLTLKLELLSSGEGGTVVVATSENNLPLSYTPGFRPNAHAARDVDDSRIRCLWSQH